MDEHKDVRRYRIEAQEVFVPWGTTAELADGRKVTGPIILVFGPPTVEDISDTQEVSP